jgi:ABC-2 type transport system permease protein
MLVFTFVFATVFKLGIKDFPVFLLAGLMPWNFFQGTVTAASGSIVASGNLVKKVYFPRAVLPLAAVFADLVNFLLALIVLFGFLIYYGYAFYEYIPFLMLIIVIQTAFTAGLAFFLAAVNVYFRDVQYILGVVLLILFYGTPIVYSYKMVETMDIMQRHPWLLTLYNLNPLVSIVTMYRNVLYDLHLPSLKVFAYGSGLSLVVLVAGFIIFNWLEPRFAEEV